MTYPDADLLQQFLTREDYAGAEAKARQLLETNPDHIAALEALAAALSLQKRWFDLKEPLERLERLAPRSPNAAMVRGYWKLGTHEYKESEESFRRAMELDPSNPVVRHDIAVTLTRQNRLPEAIAQFELAAKYHQRPQDCWRNAAVVLRRMGRYEESLALIEKARASDPGNPAYLGVMADLYLDVGAMDQSKAILDQCMASRPDMVRSTLGRWHFMAGDLPAGFRESNKFVQANLHLFRQDVPGTLWTGQSLKDKTILLYEEQGFGDTIQFIRYADMLSGRGATVFVEIRAALKQLVSRVKGVNWVYTTGQPRPQYDYRIPIVQLPLVMNTTLKNIPAKVPYMQPPARLVDYWRERTSQDNAGLRVGLCWFGSRDHDEDMRRSMSSEMLLPLAQLTNVSFYSLQRQAPPAQLEKITGPLRLIDHSSKLNDFADTAALMANLDLIVSVDTSIAHLAGATARPVWVLLCRAGEWRWMLDREDSPWYPTMRLLRQRGSSDWAPVIDRVVNEIAKLPRKQ